MLQFELRVRFIGAEHCQQIISLQQLKHLNKFFASQGDLQIVMFVEFLYKLVKEGGFSILGLIGLEHKFDELSCLFYFLSDS